MHEAAAVATVTALPSPPEPKTKPGKMTAERLAKVEQLQADLRTCAVQASQLADEEENGWQPGTPQQARTHRVDPLEKLAASCAESADYLEDLYS